MVRTLPRRLLLCPRLPPHSKSFHTTTSRIAPRSIASLIDETPADAATQDIELNTRVRSVRHQKTITFASLGDGSTFEPLQAILSPDQGQSLATGSAVRLKGAWKKSQKPASQSRELEVTNLEVLGPVDPAKYALQKKYQTAEFLRTIPHLRLRTPINTSLLRFRSKCRLKLGEIFDDAGYTHIDTPALTSSDCEGGGETFIVTTEETKKSEDNFFKSTKYLTVSAQLHLEAAAQELQKVWTLSNAFRAEKSDTSRHLSEFSMLEAELTFVEDVNEVMTVVENMLRKLVKDLYGTREGREMIRMKRPTSPEDPSQVIEETRRPALLEERWQGMMSEKWPRISYTEAISILQLSTQRFEHEPVWGLGLKSEHEDYIATTVGKGSPVFVTQYPASIKPFYMLSSRTPHEHGETVECFDLLVPDVCEIVGGSLREHALDPLISNMRTRKMIPEGSSLSTEELGSLGWYVDLRNQGYVPSGGFGLGFDRLIMYLSGVKNIREVVTFPSWVGH